MSRNPSRRAIELALCFAVMMHLLLFMAVHPATEGLAAASRPPKTSYLPQSGGTLSMSGVAVRTIKSPVIFSLPSGMGFSRELQRRDVRTRLTFSQQVQSEHFLNVAPVGPGYGALVVPQELMLTAKGGSAPSLPDAGVESLEKRPSARRVNLAPELMARLVDGVVLPPELNQEVEVPWEVRASVTVSEQGAVKHVFLDQPLESAPLNQRVLLLLYGLHFKSGGPVEGSIEIYSPESSANGGAK
ncbi:hypothetical protein [Pontiella sulfatireligans]|uniref:Uncharacterized protein n=1 Tax=Pontiella sulfatireligans TaxID=2750658 RepID=A0A6C2UQJ6_9BACT|nr:hypothetical protein [Pontiella sulfatireligans]VGO21574.1 hypothetical protein SCARR_03648 [Pontiella sulfatireligans]